MYDRDRRNVSNAQSSRSDNSGLPKFIPAATFSREFWNVVTRRPENYATTFSNLTPKEQVAIYELWKTAQDIIRVTPPETLNMIPPKKWVAIENCIFDEALKKPHFVWVTREGKKHLLEIPPARLTPDCLRRMIR